MSTLFRWLHRAASRSALLALPAAALFAQSQTVLDGVYTAAQAQRGEPQYQRNCGGCHGEDLYGRAMGALRGDKFLDRWREDSLSALFDHIRTRMPARAPGSLAEGEYLDIIAYILQVNGFPAGGKELTGTVVRDTRLVGLEGPRPLGTNALVAAVGCFDESGKDRWSLAKAGEPVRTRDAEKITAEERQKAETAPLGAHTFRLQNLEEMAGGFQPEAYRGHKAEAKGVLIRGGGGDRINVLSLAALAARCDP